MLWDYIIIFTVTINFINLSLVASKFKLALIQLAVGGDKSANLQRAVEMVREAAGNGANLMVLPECFNSPYGTSYFPSYCEPIPGESTECLSHVAKETKTYIIGGTKTSLPCIP